MPRASTCFPRRLPLALVFAAIFGGCALQQAAATTLTVTDCTDGGGSGTLRKKVAAAANNDIVQIPTTCSVISLTQGSLKISNGISNLTIAGQGSALTTIDAGSARTPPVHDRAIATAHYGTLTLKGITITHAELYQYDYTPKGGCIFSTTGMLYLSDVILQGCTIFPIAATYNTRGGAIYSYGRVFLTNSTITGARAYGANDGENGFTAYGGAIYTRNGVTMMSSTLSNNVAVSSDVGNLSRGGGIYSSAGTGDIIIQSTLSGNRADANSALQMDGASAVLQLINSTITGNVATRGQQTIASYGVTYVDNSTIAYNHSEHSAPDGPSGIYSRLKLIAHSSIFASNTAGPNYDENDVFSNQYMGGSHNLVIANSGLEPHDTIPFCPKLAPLADNGGPTKTLALLAGSIAIDQGIDDGHTTDQRGAGFSRSLGAAPDIGAFERQPGSIGDEIFWAEFESPCR